MWADEIKKTEWCEKMSSSRVNSYFCYYIPEPKRERAVTFLAFIVLNRTAPSRYPGRQVVGNPHYVFQRNAKKNTRF